MPDYSKLFSVAGISLFKNRYKVRFANDLARVKILVKNDNTDIELFELPRPMTKPEIVTFLKSSELTSKPEYLEAIMVADAKYNPVFKVKGKRGRPSKSAKIASPSLEDIKSRVKSSENVDAE